MLDVKQKGGFENVIIGMEPTGHYWKALAWYLYEKEITVVIVNLYHVKKSKEPQRCLDHSSINTTS